MRKKGPRYGIRRAGALRRVKAVLKRYGQRLQVIYLMPDNEARFWMDRVLIDIVDAKSNAIINENIDLFALDQSMRKKGFYEDQ